VNPPKHIVEFAIEAANLSPCRSKRGAAIFHGECILSTGFNHKPNGFTCDGSEGCKSLCRNDAVHAEQAAIIGAGRRFSLAEMLHVKTVDGKLVSSGPPSCLQCSKLILEAGIAAMWLYHEDGWKRYDAHTFHLLSGNVYVPLEAK
jgi:deoxycytidylate deaminase